MGTMWVPELDPNKPKYRALYEAILKSIQNDELASNSKLPPIRELAYQLGITPATVVRAYQMAVDDGKLEARKGDGTYVREKAPALDFPIKSYFMDHDGFNLFARSAPEVGQTALVNRLIGQIAQDGGFQTYGYLGVQGKRELRELTARWLNDDGFNVSKGDIVITQGADNASSIALLTMMHEQRSMVGLTEASTYTGFLGKQFLGDVTIKGVEVDEEGVIPASFRELAKNHGAGFYLTSSICANPISVTLSHERFEAIAAIAREFDMQIIDDILYSHLRLDQSGNGFRDYAPERTWTVTSLAKLGYPALNLGVLIPPSDRVSSARKMVDAVDIQTNRVQFPIMKALMTSEEFPKLIVSAREEVAARQEIAREALDGFEYSMAEGAAFLWLKVPENMSMSQLVAELGKRQVQVAPADLFAADAQHANMTTHIRLTLGGAHPREVFAEAMARVCEVLNMETMERVI